MKDKRILNPPPWIEKLLRTFCDEELLEFLLGDLHEIYNQRRQQHNKFIADVRYFAEASISIRPFLLKKQSKLNNNTMSKYNNYLKVTWRNLLKYKMYSFIKISGLAIGVAACLLISLFIIEETSYDNKYPDADNIYRLINVSKKPDQTQKGTAHNPMIAGLMKEQLPEVEKAGRLIPYSGWSFGGSNQVRPSGETVNTYEKKFAYADQELLDILQVPMVYGDRSKALAQPHSIVISRSKAEKYFPGEDPVGKTLILEENTRIAWVIGGVM